MGNKEKLISIFENFKNDYEGTQKRIKDINGDVDYTEEGRQNAIKKIIDSIAPAVQQYHDDAVAIVDAGIQSLIEKWKKTSVEKLTDGLYQTSVSNVVSMLSLGLIDNQDDIQTIIDTYKEDRYALAMIRRALQESKSEYVLLVPVDNREKNKELLVQLKKNIDDYINVIRLNKNAKTWNTFNQNQTPVSSGVDGMIEFVKDRLSDDLELLY